MAIPVIISVPALAHPLPFARQHQSSSYLNFVRILFDRNEFITQFCCIMPTKLAIDIQSKEAESLSSVESEGQRIIKQVKRLVEDGDVLDARSLLSTIPPRRYPEVDHWRKVLAEPKARCEALLMLDGNTHYELFFDADEKEIQNISLSLQKIFEGKQGFSCAISSHF
jgi:hypothetical protein